MFNILLAKLICLPWFASSLLRYIDSFESTLFPTLSEISSWNYFFVSSLFYMAFLFFKEMPDVIESLEHIVFLFLITMFEFLGLIVEFFNSF
jgi:phosphate starvation-inducible membrane PsiE